MLTAARPLPTQQLTAVAVRNAATLAAVVEAPRLHIDDEYNRRQGAGGTAGEGAGVT